jgi:hypothetical protein
MLHQRRVQYNTIFRDMAATQVHRRPQLAIVSGFEGAAKDSQRLSFAACFMALVGRSDRS